MDTLLRRLHEQETKMLDSAFNYMNKFGQWETEKALAKFLAVKEIRNLRKKIESEVETRDHTLGLVAEKELGIHG